MLDADSPDEVPGPGGVSVPRETETPPAVVPAAAGAFGPALDLAERYVQLLATDGVTKGLIGPREVPRLWDRHVLNCAALRQVVPPDASVLDIGSGAGLPGIPLTLARPDLEVVLLEPLERRYHFLRDVIAQLGLGERCRVVRARAEDVTGELSASVVTARAVAPLDRLAGWALPLIRTGGQLLAIKGRSAQEEVDAAWPVLQRWGVKEKPAVVVCDPEGDGPGTTVVRLDRGDGALRLPGTAERSRKKHKDLGSARGPRSDQRPGAQQGRRGGGSGTRRGR